MSLKSFFAALVTGLLLISCDDNTSTLGMDMVPASDLITKTYKTYGVATSSFAVGDSVLARTDTCYFGQFTDPLTNTTVKSEFITQFKCVDTTLPDSIIGDSALAVSVILYVDKFIGDSLASLTMEVYELDSLLNPNSNYYTNIEPGKLISKDAKPVGSTTFTASNRTISDSLRYLYFKNKSNNIAFNIDKEIGNSIIKGIKKGAFSDASSWLKSGIRGSKGFYFKLCGGEGAMHYIGNSLINVAFKYYDKDAKKDSIKTIVFEGTEEVIQASRFESSNIEELMANTEVTYLKSPAGIFTMAEFPVDSINVNDTINSASIKFIRYNDSTNPNASTSNAKYRIGMPDEVLMVRYDDYMNGFFENYKLNDNINSYVTGFSAKNNTYEFSNVSRLLTTMLQEKKNGTASPNYNKVLIIPVCTQKSKDNTKVVKVSHDFKMKSACLVGGKNGGVKMEVIYSKFNRR